MKNLILVSVLKVLLITTIYGQQRISISGGLNAWTGLYLGTTYGTDDYQLHLYYHTLEISIAFPGGNDFLELGGLAKFKLSPRKETKTWYLKGGVGLETNDPLENFAYIDLRIGKELKLFERTSIQLDIGCMRTYGPGDNFGISSYLPIAGLMINYSIWTKQ